MSADDPGSPAPRDLAWLPATLDLDGGVLAIGTTVYAIRGWQRATPGSRRVRFEVVTPPESDPWFVQHREMMLDADDTRTPPST